MTSDIWPNGMPRVGQVAERRRLVEASDIERFTDISGGPQPPSLRHRGGSCHPVGRDRGPGGVSTAILNAVVAEDLPGPGTVFLNVSWDFRAPVRPGDTITGRVEVTEVRDDKPITNMKTSVTRQDGAVAVEGTAVCYTLPLELH